MRGETRCSFFADGGRAADDFVTRWEPWGGLSDRFKVYKNGRPYPMTALACDAAAVLHQISERPSRAIETAFQTAIKDS